MEKHAMKKTIAIGVLIAFLGLALAWAAEQAGPSFHEQPGTPMVRRQKRFPWLLTFLGVAAIGTVVYVLTKKKKTTPPVEPEPDPSLPSYDELVRRFDYDAQLPLGITETQIEERGTTKIHHLSYADPNGGVVPALLVVPEGTGPFAAVIFLHSGQGDLYEFLDEALAIAGRGAISLLVTIPFFYVSPQSHKLHYIRTVIDLRRGVDLLLARSDVAPGRIGYVGHSFGATWGGVLAGVEKRLKAYVLMGGYGKDSSIPEQLSPYLYVGHAAPAALLFQFALNDEFISITAANEYFQAASEPKTILWYDTTHAFNAQAQFDRINWLASQLGLH
jgi:dienelactone hydrolase